MISIEQIKAARSLLGWTQRELAQHSGVSLAAASNLEQGTGKLGGKVFEAICKALELAGIEFTPEPGVRLRREKFNFRTLEGDTAIFELWDDIVATLGRTGGEVLISGVNEKKWLERFKPELTAALIQQRKLGITNRLLIAEGDNFVIIGPATYRAVPSYLFQQAPYYVYADRFAIINWGPPMRILLVINPLIAQTFRNQFEFNYMHGKMLDKKKVAIAKLEGLPYLPD